jgi:antitoxin component YwqK of YwqJK toxin-antitoxin module
MKFLRIFFWLIFFSPKCFSQDTIQKIFYQNGQLKNIQIRKDSLIFYEKNFYENGRISGEGFGILRNGKFIAKDFKRYYETGELWYSINDSLNLSYETNGQLYMKIRLFDGVKNGVTEYYLKGKLSYEIEYKNDLKNGKQISYDSETKQIRSEEIYKDGQLQGPTKKYGRNGKLIKELYYQGNCIIKVVYYNSIGKVEKVVVDKTSILLSEGKSIDCKM